MFACVTHRHMHTDTCTQIVHTNTGTHTHRHTDTFCFCAQEQRRGIPARYNDDPASMMHTVYDCAFFVARKPQTHASPAHMQQQQQQQQQDEEGRGKVED